MAALETGFSESDLALERRARMVQTWFGTWAELGWICAPDIELLVKS
jgi:hypothetical protein